MEPRQRMRVVSRLEKQMNLIEFDLLTFLSYYNKDPNTFTGFTDIFYRGKALREKRFSRYGDAISLNVQSIILRLERLRFLLERQRTRGCPFTHDLSRLIGVRRGFLERKCDEFLIAVYELRLEDMELDKQQLKVGIVDTLERLRHETKNYSYKSI